MNLRKYARGKPCQIRLPGCRPGNETVSLCHLRTATTGAGQKEPDLLAADGCEWCHSIVDGKRSLPGWTKDEIALAFAEGIFRTQKSRIEEGIVKW